VRNQFLHIIFFIILKSNLFQNIKMLICIVIVKA